MYGGDSYAEDPFGGEDDTIATVSAAAQIFSVIAPSSLRVPVGNVVLCRFAFTVRTLEVAEIAAFLAGNGLPDGAGIDPDLVFFDYAPPRAAIVTLTGDSIDEDETGAWHVPLPVVTRGDWLFRARATNSDGTPFAETAVKHLTAVDGLARC